MGASNPPIDLPTPHRRRYESPRQRERQRKILATARALLDEQGYAGMTMRELARSAGVAQGTLYNLYSSKDELIVAAVDDLLTELGEQAVAAETAPGFDAIIQLAWIMGSQIEKTPNYAEAIARALFKAQPEDPIVEVTFGRFIPAVTGHLHRAAALEDLRPDVAIAPLARHLAGQNWSVILQWLMGVLPAAEIGRETVRSQMMTLAGVATRAANERLAKALQAL
ncbi:MAG: TetR/AcrR family transcriptional regulator [Pseudomonadota bacterium]